MAIKPALLNRRVWTPAQLTSELWLDAADSSTFTLNSNKIIQWNDKSGNARHISQSNDANRPTLVSNQLNGLPSVVFNGTTNTLNGSTAFNAISFAAILQKNNQITNIFSTTNTSIGLVFLFAPSPNFDFRIGVSGSQQTYTPITSTDFSLLSGSRSPNNFFFNGSSVSSAITTASVAFNTNFQLGARGTTLYFSGKISELIIFNYSLTSTQRELLEGYLAFKWGLQSFLLSNHPYKNTCPFI